MCAHRVSTGNCYSRISSKKAFLSQTPLTPAASIAACFFRLTRAPIEDILSHAPRAGIPPGVLYREHRKERYAR